MDGESQALNIGRKMAFEFKTVVYCRSTNNVTDESLSFD